MSSNNNATNNFPSLCIPRVYPNINEDRIRKIFQELALGELERIDIVSKTSDKGEKFNRVFIHFKMWYTEGNAEIARKRLLEGKDIKIMYDDPWFWKVSAYKEANLKPKSNPEKKYAKPKVALIIESDDDDEPTDKRSYHDERRPTYDDRRPRDDRRPAQYDERRPAQYDDRRPAYDKPTVKRPYHDDRRPAQYDDSRFYDDHKQAYHDDRKPAYNKYDNSKPKPNEGFKKTKKEDFNNIAPALSENNRPYRQPIAKALPLSLKPEPVLEPVVVKQELLEDLTAFEPALIQITPENAKQYIGECVTFKHDSKCIVKRIESVSETGKSIRVDCPEVENSLQIVTRNVHLLNGAIIPDVAAAVAEKPLMKPRVIKSKEQKEKDKKSNQLLAAHAISSQIINPRV